MMGVAYPPTAMELIKAVFRYLHHHHSNLPPEVKMESYNKNGRDLLARNLQ